MTAEIAVLNKQGLALATDSAVTIGAGDKNKIFNTANKLFSLSKYHPVGIMVYNSASFMGIPWETVIKSYRSQLETKCFDFTEDYANNFLAFLKSAKFASKSDQDRYFTQSVTGFFANKIVENIHDKVHESIDCDKELDGKTLKGIVRNVIDEYRRLINSQENLDNLPRGHKGSIVKKYSTLIQKIIKDVFEDAPITATYREKLIDIAANLFCKKYFDPQSVSGIVIGGFGEKERFPALYAYHIEGTYNNVLKYAKDKDVQITDNNSATIIPFAQREMVDTFMAGIDPNLNKLLQSAMRELLLLLPNHMLGQIPNLKDADKKKKSKEFIKFSEDLLEDFNKKIEDFRESNYVLPVMSAVASLPKEELASMAESLINITSLKRRVTLGEETVGGPIDVALITKGDGYIWIKRKHYFKPELNFSFFQNYFR